MLKQQALGKTGIKVSQLGLGTVKFGRNQKVHYPAAFTLPTDKEALAILDLAQSLGINLLDTAPAYGESEEKLGKWLKGKRSQWVLATKVGEEFIDGVSHYDFSAAHIRYSIKRSLQRLQTDHLDIVLVHSNGEDSEIIAQHAVFETLAELKQQGHIRAYGMSTKTIAGGLQTVDAADVVMVTYHPQHIAEQAVIQYAHQQGKAVFIKKALASGHLDKFNTQEDPVKMALRFIMQEPGVTSVVLGTINPEHLKHNVSCVTEAL